MSPNPNYFRQIRARGRCVICLEPMPDPDPHLAHASCTRLANEGWTRAQIRALSADARVRHADASRRRRPTRPRPI